jgi:hypothetical protein
MRQLFIASCLAALAGAGAGCSGNGLGNAQIENTVDTVVLGSLVGTPISVPSAYAVATASPIRTDQTTGFDFAYDQLPDGRHVFLPLALLGVSSSTAAPGLQLSDKSFADLTDPPSDGYTTIDTILVSVGQVYAVRGRVVCTTLGVPQYAKIHILSFDDADRTVTFEALANTNCGFRSLVPGIPGD